MLDELDKDLLQASAQIQQDSFVKKGGDPDWAVFGRSITWNKLKKKMSNDEQTYFRHVWEEDNVCRTDCITL